MRSRKSSDTRSSGTHRTLPPPTPPAKPLHQTHSEMISYCRAAPRPPGPGLLPAAHDTTSQISIVDAQRNAGSMTTTVNMNFGATLATRGIIFNDAFTNFSRLDRAPSAASATEQANTMEPGKQPITFMVPTVVLDPVQRLRLVAGSAGDGSIPNYVARQVLGIIVYRVNPQEVLNQPDVSEAFSSRP